MTIGQKTFIFIVAVFLVSLLYLLSPIMMPFFIAGLLAYLGDPLVRRLVRYSFPRTFAVILVFSVMLLAILALALMFIPLLERQLVVLIQKFPLLLNWLQQDAVPWLDNHFGLQNIFDVNAIKTTMAGHWQQAGNIVTTVIKTVGYSGHAVIGWLLNLFLVPVVTFYLLRDWESLVGQIRVLIPRKIEAVAVQLLSECNEVLGAFFRGQLLVMISLGFVYAAGLSLIGIEVALIVGMISGLLSIVPYLGFFVGLIMAIFAALIQYHDALHLLYVGAVFVIGHIIEGFILTPWLVGDKIGLHPVAVIFAILAGGQLFGFIGVLFALPIAAVIMVVIRYLKQQYISSQLYQ